VEETCSHRGASLWLGRNEEGGLRCLYHGWKIDVDGNVLDTPCEPAGSSFKDRVKHRAYGTHEQGDMVWVYMGPREKRPPFPSFEWTLVPDPNRSIAKVREECNYLQGVEGTVDSSHGDSLHSGLDTLILKSAPLSMDTAPRFEMRDMPYGFVYAAIREPVEEPEKYNYVRTTNFVFPSHAIVPPRGFGHIHMFVPIDDEHTWDYSIYYSQNRRIDHGETLQRRRSVPGADLLPEGRKIRNMENRFLQDRVAMRERRSFTGIPANTNEDMAVQESMGPLYDRTREHLGASDAAVIWLRRRMLEAVQAFERGQDPPGLEPDLAYEEVRSYHKLLPTEIPWYEIGSYPGEDIMADYARAAAGGDHDDRA
jgi:phthalate 4,5-dioxygenase oxygenase subunit